MVRVTHFGCLWTLMAPVNQGRRWKLLSLSLSSPLWLSPLRVRLKRRQRADGRTFWRLESSKVHSSIDNQSTLHSNDRVLVIPVTLVIFKCHGHFVGETSLEVERKVWTQDALLARQVKVRERNDERRNERALEKWGGRSVAWITGGPMVAASLVDEACDKLNLSIQVTIELRDGKREKATRGETRGEKRGERREAFCWWWERERRVLARRVQRTQREGKRFEGSQVSAPANLSSLLSASLFPHT